MSLNVGSVIFSNAVTDPMTLAQHLLFIVNESQ